MILRAFQRLINRFTYKKEVKAFGDIIRFGYLTDDQLPEDLKKINEAPDGTEPVLVVHNLDTDEKQEMPYKLNHVYEIESPKLYFAICVNSKRHRYILVDRDVKTAEIEAMSFDWDNISIKGLEVNDKKVTVVIELVTQ